MISRFSLQIFTIIASVMYCSVVQAIPSSVFTSVEATVQAAANTYNPISIEEDREYMGVIFKKRGQYTYSVSSGDVGEDSINIRILPEDWQYVVAFWHTHGNAAKGHQYFSDVDTATANRYQKPFYLADFTGKLKVFYPDGYTMTRYAARKLGLRGKRGYSFGERVMDSNNMEITVNTNSI